MKERPIVLTATEVRGFLDGRKTQIRRVVKPQIVPFDGDSRGGVLDWESEHGPLRRARVTGMGKTFFDDIIRFGSPYGQPGDLLWVRETWGSNEIFGKPIEKDTSKLVYRADGSPFVPDCGWKPSIHMPRWASRLTLRITNVRVERLQDISEEDAEAEGAPLARWYQPFGVPEINAVNLGAVGDTWNPSWDSICHLNGFANLWDSINPKRPWESNPWVWVIEFEVVQP